MKKLFHLIQNNHFLLTIFLLGAATGTAFLLFRYIPESTANIALLYILALVLTARWTSGYFYGIFAAVICVVCVNFLFTYPYFQLNFTLSGYPVTFIGMLSIALITSTTTSHLKKQSRILAEKEKQLAEADREKMRANLLRAVSHDLRTPLTSILGAASSYIENGPTYEEKEVMHLMQHILDDAGWLLNMVENLLSVTRIQNDCQTVKTCPEVVDEVISEAVQRLKKRIPNAEITVRTPDDFLMIPMDAMLIEQVIINLLENALTHAGSIVPPLLSVDSDETCVTFHIFDYGEGIAKDRLDHIFDGSSGPHVAADGKKGMGIGLSICKSILSAHHGELFARNHKNGAEFYFTLPKEEPNA